MSNFKKLSTYVDVPCEWVSSVGGRVSDVTDLKEELLLLHRENAELRENLKFIDSECEKDFLEFMNMLEENAKLRDLVRDMWDFYCVMSYEPHEFEEELDFTVEVWKRMRELGVNE